MRAANAVEPTLSWPADNRPPRLRPVAVSDDEWSSRNVATATEPLGRIAALLLSISQNNRYEGRDPHVLPDGLTSGFVADLLGLEIAELAALLVDLRRRGLVDTDQAAALTLKDIDGLERLTH